MNKKLNAVRVACARVKLHVHARPKSKSLFIAYPHFFLWFQLSIDLDNYDRSYINATKELELWSNYKAQWQVEATATMQLCNYVWRGSIVSGEVGGEITCHFDRRTLSWLYPVEVNYVSSCVAVVNQPIRIGIDQGYLPFIWGGRQFWLESPIVHAIPFGKLQKLWAVVWGEAIFPLFLVCSVNLDIFCSG